MQMFKPPLLSFMMLLVMGCQDQAMKTDAPAPESPDVESTLPYTPLALDDLSSFQQVGKNWSVVKSVSCDYQLEHDIKGTPGTGVLLNLPEDNAKDNLATQFEHGDLEIQFEVMMPNNSNSGVYFQGRYEVQLLDSWKRDDPSHGDMGGIYQRWDESRSEGEKGYDGVAPQINASKAPGLWQHFHVLFRAPRFDQNNNKVENARFEFVRLNGMLIHENVDLTGPTRAHQLEGEVAQGPLYFQGDHGPVAFRHIRYKAYHLDTLELNNISYQIFNGKYDFIPNFDSLAPISKGEVANLDLKSMTSLTEGFCALINGDLTVRKEGEYLFETSIDDGGDLYIDSVLVVHNEGEPGIGTERGKVFLSEGTHALKITYYQEVWNATLAINYEGPGIFKRSLAAPASTTKGSTKSDPLTLSASKTPTLLRGFVMYGGEKLTHTISVSEPAGIHYSYDLSTASLVKSWRGPFGNLANMWQGRGQSQIHEPMVASIQLTQHSHLAKLDDRLENPWPGASDALVYQGYAIDHNERPVFLYQFDEIKVRDQITPEDDKLKRTIRLVGSIPPGLTFRIARAKQIEKLPNGLHSIDGAYYVAAPDQAFLRSQDHSQELLYTISDSTFSYTLLW